MSIERVEMVNQASWMWAVRHGYDHYPHVAGALRRAPFDGGPALSLHRWFYGPDAERKAAADLRRRRP